MFRSVLLLCVVAIAAGKIAKPAECCKIMGSLDCTACKEGTPLIDADLRDIKPDTKALHLPKAAKRFSQKPKLIQARPHIISAEADDVTNGAPIACPQGSPNCYRPAPTPDCQNDVNFAGRVGIPGAPCLQPGQNVGPILRPGGKFAPMFPAPYGLPHYPFPPDQQDWNRPAMLTAENEGEISPHEQKQQEDHELSDKDGADSR